MTFHSKPMTRRDAVKTLGAMGMAAGVAPSSWGQSRKPNFVIIYADDLGYGDLSCYGSETIETPNLDQMAAEGLKFESFYVCAAVCTPSRAGLLTGRQPMRSGMTRVLFPFSEEGLSQSEITLAEALKKEGYATACIGKWHLGHLPPYLPTRHGFDYYYGVPYSNDMNVERRGDPPIPLMRNEEIIEQPAHQATLTKRYAQEAAQFIREHKDEPFFLYVPHTMPHIPLFVSDEFKGVSEGGLYGDVIEEIDWSVGQILDEIKAQGLDEDTLVIFSSDNGPWLVMDERGGSSGKLRHGKGTVFEGGVRVPCVMRWPGKIEAGRVTNEPAITFDLFPTLVALAGGEMPDDREYDGYDIRPLIFGTGERPDEEFYFFRGRDLRAHRSGKWKVKKPFDGNVYGEPLQHDWLLFNLEEDPYEQNNLAEEHPEILSRMQDKMERYVASLGDLPPEKR